MTEPDGLAEHAARLAQALETARESKTWTALPLLVRANVNRALRLYQENAHG